jgi:hypothetical protein
VLERLDPSGRTLRLVIAVAADDRAPQWSERAILAAGLDALAAHFKLPPSG